MLRDRRVLLEQEIKEVKEDAARCYLEIVTSGEVFPLPQKYQLLKSKVEELQFDLVMVNQLIEQGHE